VKTVLQLLFFSAVTLSATTLCTSAPAFAAHPLITDDAGTLGKGTVQVELNGDVGTDKETNAGQTINYNSSQIASTMGVGVTDKIDITFGYTRPWGSGDEAGTIFKDNGSSDFSLSMKWQVYEREGFTVAVKPQIDYSYALGVPEDDHTISYGATLIFSKELEAFAFHLNLGYTYNDYNLAEVRETSRNSILNFSLATTYEVIKDLKAVADFGAATAQDETANEMLVFGLAGFIYSLNNIVDLSAGVKVGLTNPETDFAGTFGITLKF
jgi:hypothetical protein